MPTLACTGAGTDSGALQRICPPSTPPQRAGFCSTDPNPNRPSRLPALGATAVCPDRKRRFGLTADELAETATIAKLNDAWHFRKQRIVFPAPDILAGLVARAALPDDNGATRHHFAAENLYAEPLGVGITAILRTA